MKVLIKLICLALILNQAIPIAVLHPPEALPKPKPHHHLAKHGSHSGSDSSSDSSSSKRIRSHRKSKSGRRSNSKKSKSCKDNHRRLTFGLIKNLFHHKLHSIKHLGHHGLKKSSGKSKSNSKKSRSSSKKNKSGKSKSSSSKRRRDTCDKNDKNEVCGVDGVTYKNLYYLQKANVKLDYKGPCKKPCICPQIYQPCCGADGQTYSNECLARCSNAKIAYNGPCGYQQPYTNPHPIVIGAQNDQ